ncbi:MAG: hypothetical protein K0R67_2395 [Paenibacillus sp.]|jgi:uncharacterized damage-inducible protein DinB|nr:hypothetical protein [Paenibacillus sp.]
MAQFKLPLLEEWLKHRSILEELLQRIDNQHVHYKPWEDAMTLGGMALHLAGSAYAFVSLVKTGSFARPEVPECNSMDEVRKQVTKLTAKTKAMYESITQQELNTIHTSPRAALNGPRVKLLSLVYDHELHHKGQLFLYARLAGVKDLPFFR